MKFGSNINVTFMTFKFENQKDRTIDIMGVFVRNRLCVL